MDGKARDVSNREEMEATLVPIIRVALRSGRGQPVVVEWVERNLPVVVPAPQRGRGMDLDWAAPRMARLLCSQMLQKVQSELVAAGPRKTVVGL